MRSRVRAVPNSDRATAFAEEEVRRQLFYARKDI